MADEKQDNPQVDTETTEIKPEAARTFTQDEVNQLIGERIKREREKYVDYDDLKAKSLKLDEIEEANKTELQKALDKAAELEAKVQQAEASRQAAERKARIVSEATRLNFADPDDAVHLVGDAQDIEAALSELAEKKSYLLKTEQKQPKPQLKPSSPGPLEKTETRDERRARIMGMNASIDPFSPAGAAQLGGGLVAPLGNMQKIVDESPTPGEDRE